MVKVGDKSDAFFVIIKGKVGVWIILQDKRKEKDFELKEIKTLSSGDSFGEMGLLSERNNRTATIITKSHCDFVVLYKSDFLETIGTYISIKKKRYQIYRRNNRKNKFLDDSHFFQKMEPSTN